MTGRSERVLTATGAGLGLLIVGGGVLAALRSMATSSQSDWRGDPWRLVIVGFGALPYAFALTATFGGASRCPARWSLLAAATLLSLAVAFATGFSIGFLFLPSTALLAAATVAALASGPRSGEGAPLTITLAIGVVVAWVLGIVALFAGPNTERCWATTSYEDGRVERSEFEHRAGEPLSMGPPGSGVVSQSQSCASDVVTASEGMRAGALLLGASALAWLSLRPPQARNQSSRI